MLIKKEVILWSLYLQIVAWNEETVNCNILGPKNAQKVIRNAGLCNMNSVQNSESMKLVRKYLIYKRIIL